MSRYCPVCGEPRGMHLYKCSESPAELRAAREKDAEELQRLRKRVKELEPTGRLAPTETGEFSDQDHL